MRPLGSMPSATPGQFAASQPGMQSQPGPQQPQQQRLQVRAWALVQHVPRGRLLVVLLLLLCLVNGCCCSYSSRSS